MNAPHLPAALTLPPWRMHVLLASVPPLLADIVRDALAGEDGVTVEAAGDGDLARAVYTVRPDLLLTAETGALAPEPLLELMYRHPRLRLLLVSPDGRTAAMYRLAPERRPIADPGPRTLREAVRAAAAEG